ncbi:S41 family peptidase [Paraflavitalea sp. CAU 1676]|uniref:S41 family peptidase n=1 Tax=Paraflavitalea sp. CAU 1676 TaxID=3032598 RepID=UPI0023DC52E5|nr:S41 family peptidase [Paraflavitalea sp. CAU 1676]MDF2191684.1 S41 family peptidase [Paraflavitalea sp. CAU 1676]
MRRLLLILAASCCVAGSATAQGQRLSAGKTAYLADYDLYRTILEKAHAGLYKYHTKKQVDSVFNHYRRRIDASITLLDYYAYLSSILSYTGSLHDDVSLPENYLDQLKAPAVYFPYPLKWVGGQLLVNIDGQEIPAGAAIVAIDGEPIKNILPRLYKYYTTDGHNISGKLTGIANSFPLYYRYEFGPRRSFKVSYLPYGARQVQHISLTPATYAEYTGLRKQRHSLPLDTLADRRYSFQLIDRLSTAILTVNTFSLGGPQSEKHAAYKRFLRECFTTLQSKGVKHLVVDIRRNGGGSDPNDLLTFSYLARHPFKENREAYTLFQQVPFKQYYYTDDSTEVADLEANFREEHNQLRGGKYYQDPAFNKIWQPDSLAFQGKVYLLISPAVASAASLFASMVKSEGYATVIGEESMGGYYGHTGHNKVAYQLPLTRIDFSFSVVDLLQYVQPTPGIRFGDGIIPDTIVFPSQKDFLANEDNVLQYTLDLISHQP